MIVTLEFAIDRTIIRRFDVDEEHFKDTLYLITPPPLRETGLPFDQENVLHIKPHVLALWNFFFMCEEPESLAYTGRFLDTLIVTNFKGNYSVQPRRVGKKVHHPKQFLLQIKYPAYLNGGELFSR
jgi:hypothetical protein